LAEIIQLHISRFSIFLFLFSTPLPVTANGSVTAYFSNDSVNGLKISDAYETHNMGLQYMSNKSYFGLDLGIVSPDMHVYKNQYRVANRSFGEIVTVSYGRKVDLNQKIKANYYTKISASGKFGIDKMQDFMHQFLTLQPVNAVNDLVRMPNEQWVGLGASFAYDLEEKNYGFDSLNLAAYAGSDRVELSTSLQMFKNFTHYNLLGELGIKSVNYDNIVSAPPILAEHRSIIPFAEIGLEFTFFGAQWFVKDRFSLPTLESDDSLFGVLSAGVTFPVN